MLFIITVADMLAHLVTPILLCFHNLLYHIPVYANNSQVLNPIHS